MMFPPEIFEKITLHAKSENVSEAFDVFLSQRTRDKLFPRQLMYAPVQSGKTAQVIKELVKPTPCIQVLLLQNSLLMLKQMKQRLIDSGVEYHIVSNNTPNVEARVLLVIKNKSRLNAFKKMKVENYNLFVDEADQSINNKLVISLEQDAEKVVHITSTPYNLPANYNKVIKAPVHKGYRGVASLRVNKIDDAISEFSQCDAGIMLSTIHRTVADMNQQGMRLSIKLKDVPIIQLNSRKTYVLNGRRMFLGNWSISKIIDFFETSPKLVIIAHKIANRGLSFVSSDYKRHITHQVCITGNNITNFMQKLRILGVHPDVSEELNVYVDDTDAFEDYKEKVLNFDVDTLAK